MASKNTINGKTYVRIQKVVGHKLNAAGIEVPVRKTFYGKTKKEAERKYKAFVLAQESGIDSKEQYFGISVERWIETFFKNDPAYAPTTKLMYINAWKNYLKDDPISHLKIEEVTASKLQQFYNNVDCSAAALKKIHNLIRKFYKYLNAQGISRDFTDTLVIDKKKAKAGSLPTSGKEEIIVWSDEEARKLLHSFDKQSSRFRLRFLVFMAYYTGCRISELLALKYDDIDIEAGTVSVKRQLAAVTDDASGYLPRTDGFITTDLKTSTSARTIPLNNEVLREFQIHKKWHKRDQMKNGYRTEFLFTTDAGLPYDRGNVRHALNRYYKAIGLPIKSIHTYRHTFATNLVKSGVPIQIASTLLGHADINVTAKYYVNVDLEQKREAVKHLSTIVL